MIRPRFACDRSLGRLAKWLRILGYDTLFGQYVSDAGLAGYAKQGRIVATRTVSVFKKVPREARVWIADNDPKDQLGCLAVKLGLVWSPELVFSRCVLCNLPVEPVDKDKISGHVPDYILGTRASFSSCPRCKRIYWPGTHAQRSVAHLEACFNKPPRGGEHHKERQIT